MASHATAQREHGGLRERELAALGIAAAEVLDFSVNVNHYGPCPAVLAAARSAAIERYPDSTARLAREAIARSIGARPDELVLGNGAAELLWTIARVLVSPGRTALVVEPTFSEFRAAVAASGGRTAEWRAREADGFALELGAIERSIRGERVDCVYLCNPNNPTGLTVCTAEVFSLCRANPGVVFVLDQAFLSLSAVSGEARLALPPNVIAVRSITKEHAIPGLRVGYLVAERSLAERIEHARPAWTTSAPAQAAAIAACEEEEFVEESRRKLLADRASLEAALRAIGLEPSPSVTTFLLVKTGDAKALRESLLTRHRILVRDCASFGLPDHIRLGARPNEDTRRLVAALAAERSR